MSRTYILHKTERNVKDKNWHSMTWPSCHSGHTMDCICGFVTIIRSLAQRWIRKQAVNRNTNTRLATIPSRDMRLLTRPHWLSLLLIKSREESNCAIENELLKFLVCVAMTKQLHRSAVLTSFKTTVWNLVLTGAIPRGEHWSHVANNILKSITFLQVNIRAKYRPTAK